jgi:hypothetical protein
MRQTFPFAHPRHKPAQALEQLKNRIRKYLKRERRKALPDGVDYWDFDCKIGAQEDAAETVHVAELISRLDALAAEGHTQVYVEILAKPGYRGARPAAEAPDS